MTVRADFLVDPEATLELRIVIGPERRGETPALMRDLQVVVSGRWRGGTRAIFGKRYTGKSERKKESHQELKAGETSHRTSSRFRLRAAGGGVAFVSFVFLVSSISPLSSGPSTDSVMLPGSARGRSIKPVTGMTTRKKAK